jgi:hypothetical protein
MAGVVMDALLTELPTGATFRFLHQKSPTRYVKTGPHSFNTCGNDDGADWVQIDPHALVVDVERP